MHVCVPVMGGSSVFFLPAQSSRDQTSLPPSYPSSRPTGKYRTDVWPCLYGHCNNNRDNTHKNTHRIAPPQNALREFEGGGGGGGGGRTKQGKKQVKKEKQKHGARWDDKEHEVKCIKEVKNPTPPGPNPWHSGHCYLILVPGWGGHGSGAAVVNQQRSEKSEGGGETGTRPQSDTPER